MFWTPSELEELQGSAVKNKIGKAAAEEKWKTTIVPFMQRHPEVFPVDAFNSDIKLLELAHMAGSLIMAYAFDIGEDGNGQEGEDGFIEDDEADPHKALVPFADMLNADADQNNVSDSQVSPGTSYLLLPGSSLPDRWYPEYEGHEVDLGR
jgi:N-lysine methyltransferase SETD6